MGNRYYLPVYPVQPLSQVNSFLRGNTMSETKKIIIGVLGGVLGIAILFTLVLMLIGKKDEPVARLQPILAQEPVPVPPDPPDYV